MYKIVYRLELKKYILFLLYSLYDGSEKYIDMVNEMYGNNNLNDEDIENLDLEKNDDNFEI